MDGRTGFVGVGLGREIAQRLAHAVGLPIMLAVAIDIELEPVGQCVHDRHADTMKAA